jgi:hypothetical protein
VDHRTSRGISITRVFSRFRDVVVLLETGAMKRFGTRFKARVEQILVYLSTPILTEPPHPSGRINERAIIAPGLLLEE